ncbi:MAG: DNA mismatch repair protein MutS [Clostridia bacterium]|nr:DNA mismatch repair protein MutS [Clostridia bacterium]
MTAVTPMMRQYLEIKHKYKESILFFRLGDFYEMFYEDAVLASRELELTLTGKDCGLAERAPMCGVPYHSAASYITRLIDKGYKVAICEQLTDPAAGKGLVERDVVRIITPGTVVDPAMLDEKKNRYVLCLAFAGKGVAMAYADVSTGEFIAHWLPNAESALRDEMVRVDPQEVLTNNKEALIANMDDLPMMLTRLPEAAFAKKGARELLLDHFHVATLTAIGLEEQDKRVSAAGGPLRYLSDTQKNDLRHFTRLTVYQGGGTMYLDRATRKNLELTESIRSGERRGSLLWLLDETSTAMGARMLRSWVETPLTDPARIRARLDAVEALKEDWIIAQELAEALDNVSDLERLLSKISYHSLTGRDCLALRRSLLSVGPIKKLLQKFTISPMMALQHTLAPLTSLCELIEAAIHPEAPLSLADGGVIADGYHSELDQCRSASISGKQWVLELEAAERRETGIKNLKIQYNRVFGYLIEVTKSYLGQVPLRYVRRQTLANCERFVTPELQEIERKITGAQQQAQALEGQLFGQVKEAIAREIGMIQQNALILKTLDALLSLAKVARSYHYVKPAITEDGIIRILDGRHPIVEKTQTDTPFVPNDALLDNDENRMLIITGPNMAGKSSYMRQIALMTLMAHMGSFLPAGEASISVCDRVFTRIGASDDLASGQSTFMVEMSETASILRNATGKSLIVLDEIGRGTSTFDGLSIAWAVVEYLLDPNKIGAKTLFATHYHELAELGNILPRARNANVSVQEWQGRLVFLHKIADGPCDRSYGLHVAMLAGLPRPVVERAREILEGLESQADERDGDYLRNGDALRAAARIVQQDLFAGPLGDPEGALLHLYSLDLDRLKPDQALAELKNIRAIAGDALYYAPARKRRKKSDV